MREWQIAQASSLRRVTERLVMFKKAVTIQFQIHFNVILVMYFLLSKLHNLF